MSEVNLNGVLERIIFSNEETHYCVGELRQEKCNNQITVTGNLPGVQCGETLQLTGHWEFHQRHGNQFKIQTFRSVLPSSVHGIRMYLGSGLVEGIGKVYANKIVDHFGTETLEVIAEDSGRLLEVAGIGKQRARSIKTAWTEQQAMRDVMLFLHTYGVSSSNCLQLVKKYGNNAKTVLQTEPYTVAREVRGIGFKTADRIAINLGFSNESPARIDAGIIYAMQQLEDEGHTGYSTADLVPYASQLLETENEIINERIKALKAENYLRLSTSNGLLQLPITAKAEDEIAQSVNRLISHASTLPPIILDKVFSWVEERVGFELTSEQVNAVSAALTQKVSIITGGPGTGKTTILLAIVKILGAKKVRILLASPTGRAAQRMSEATDAFAQTIHRLLNFDPHAGRFKTCKSNPLNADFIIVDEASMLDTRLASALFNALPVSAHVLLVGDVNQLPSIGAGNVLSDLIKCRKFKVTRLQRIFRQEEQSKIIATAHNILNNNATPPFVVSNTSELIPHSDLHFIRKTDPDACLDTVIDLCRNYIPAKYTVDPLLDVQVLAPMHRGVAGISNFNRELQNALNPNGKVMQFGQRTFSIGDKVLQNRNNYEKNIFNGDLGRINHLDPEAGSIAVNFDNEVIDYTRAELDNLQLAYAISVHKAQGSEFPIVIIPLLKQHFMLLQRNLLYTAITRGKSKVFIVGDPAAYAIAVRNKESTSRRTDLQRKILELSA